MTEKEKIQRKLNKYGLSAVNKAKATPHTLLSLMLF